MPYAAGHAFKKRNAVALNSIADVPLHNSMPRNMSEPKDVDTGMENDYDEEGDSDFNAGEVNDDVISSSSDDEDAEDAANAARLKKRRKTAKVAQSNEVLVELDSGDEATIREREKMKRKQKKNRPG